VELDAFNRKEGLVHIAQIQQGMVRDAKQVVKRGQKVKVKIISMVGTKMALSMKEVDQTTGEDLLPQRSKDAMAKLTSDLSNPSRPPGDNSHQVRVKVWLRLRIRVRISPWFIKNIRSNSNSNTNSNSNLDSNPNSYPA
jgi:hypothetical protein